MMEKIRETFKDYFEGFGIELPEKIEDKGHLNADGWSISYVLTTDEAGKPCLDFLAEHRMTNMRHVRIHQDGEITDLETIQEVYGHNPEIEGDEARAEKEYLEHNERVTAMLHEKGLI